jgi:hypothetical protein
VKILVSLCTALALLAAGACGGGDETTDTVGTGVELPDGHDSVAVIDEWVRTLREGDVVGAAELFALPSVVQNGTPPTRLDTRAEAIDFNRSLPCGAELVRARRLGRLIAATFRLTERPGAGECGTGAGNLARTAFLVRDGKIVRWLRLPDVPEDEPSGPVV